ncbi:MAG: helicase C-terminal domain-containing protein [Myxococcota bacterium]|nr:helicase C-terminal domain-containing protein [Myxococcota bacterium]
MPSARICQAPLEVGPLLRERLFESVESVTLTSATLTVGGRFDHLLERLGLKDIPAPPPRETSDEWTPTAFADSQELDEPTWSYDEDTPLSLHTGTYPSPFDYQQQALLLVPRDLPEPDDPAFFRRAGQLLARAIEHTGGGAFVLCTSYRALTALHQVVQERLVHPPTLLRQGDMGRQMLLERFREDSDSVLFATDSFWEGVSVKGEALRLVAIPRLPFRVPAEPVQQARHEALEARGLDPFRAYSLPQAVLRLRQGVGRLVRSQQDRGAVLVLDRRISHRWYGRVFLASLPDMRRCTGPERAVMPQLRGFFGN